MNALISFQFGNNNVRIQQDIDNQPWFNAQDVCAILEMGNPRQALDSHIDEDDVQKLEVIDNLGRTQKANFVNESGLYALIFGCTKEAAKTFKKWVTSEVLPAIRKTGGYQVKSPVQDEFTRALKLAPLAVKALRALGCDKNNAAISANQLIRKQTQVDLLALSGNTHLVAENQDSLYYAPTELGQQLGGLSAIKVNKLLEVTGLQTKQAGHWKPTKTGQIHARLFDTAKRHSDGAPIQQVKWANSVIPLLPAA